MNNKNPTKKLFAEIAASKEKNGYQRDTHKSVKENSEINYDYLEI